MTGRTRSSQQILQKFANERRILRACARMEEDGFRQFEAISFRRTIERSIREVFIRNGFTCTKEEYKEILTLMIGGVYEYGDTLADTDESPKTLLEKYAAALAIEFIEMTNNGR